MNTGRLLRHFDRTRRAMPWRRKRPQPYAVWVSEIMLQQTQVATVIPYFRRFLARFPTVQVLARTDIHDVLKLWEGLGYYTRVRNLHRAAATVADRFKGRLPRTAAELVELPGIGHYTAAAIASICFHEPVPVVDGNVLRVFSRFLAIRGDVKSARVRERIEAFLAEHIPSDRPGDFNQAIMELGATVCRPVSPQCAECPLADDCRALKLGLADRPPERAGTRPVPLHREVAGVIRKGDRLLLVRRPLEGFLGGLWEFPGGRCERGEGLESALRRTVRAATGLEVGELRSVCTLAHAYSHFKVELHVFECGSVTGRVDLRRNRRPAFASAHRDGSPYRRSPDSGVPAEPHGHGRAKAGVPGQTPSVRWVSMDQISDLALATVHRRALERLKPEQPVRRVGPDPSAINT